MVQQTYQEQTTNSKNPLWDGNPPWGERISAENLMAIGKSFNLKKQNMTKESLSIFGLTQKLGRISFIVIILNQEVQLACREIIPYFQDKYYWTKLFREEIYDAGGGLEKSQNIWGKNKFNYIDIAGKDGILYLSTTLRTHSSRWKDLKKALHLIPFRGWKQAHVVSSRGTAYLWDKILQVTLKSPGSAKYSQVWTWEERSMNSECCSVQRTSGIESYVWFRRLWRSVSQRRMPRETEKHKQQIFHSKQCWFQMKRRQWKRNERRS